MSLRIAPSEMTRFPHISGMSPVTAKLIDRLKDGKPGDTLADAELETVAGVRTDPNGKAYPNLLSACRYVLRHHGVRWERVVGAGSIKCLNDSETIVSVERDRDCAGRRVRRAGVKLGTVDFAKLPAGEKSTALVLKAQLGAMAGYASGRTAKRLASNQDLDKWQAEQRKMLSAI